MKLSNELKSEIDLILSELLNGNNCSDNNGNTSLRKQSIRICKGLNLIKPSTCAKQYELNNNGVLVLNDGGIEKYLLNVSTEKDLDITIKELTSKRLKYDVLYNIMYVLFGGLIGIITILVQPDNSKEYIKEIHKSASEKVEHNDNFQKHLNDINIEILSLKKEVNSIKNKP
jgi:hypothetical protein